MSKSIKLDMRLWSNDRTGHIHIGVSKALISTVSADPASKRYHPNLFRKLAKVLREHSAPAPPKFYANR